MELHDIYPEFSAAFRGGFSFADTRFSVSLCKGTPKYNCPKSATQRIDEKTFMWYNKKKRRNRCFFAVFLLMNGMKNHCKKVYLITVIFIFCRKVKLCIHATYGRRSIRTYRTIPPLRAPGWFRFPIVAQYRESYPVP